MTIVTIYLKQQYTVTAMRTRVMICNRHSSSWSSSNEHDLYPNASSYILVKESRSCAEGTLQLAAEGAKVRCLARSSGRRCSGPGSQLPFLSF